MFKKFLNNKAQILEKLDSQRIYVENIRAYFGVSTKVARFMCEMAVKDKLFKKKVGVCCNNIECERILKVADNKSEIEETLLCDICLSLEREEYEFNSKDLNFIEFYQLVK